MADAAYPKGDLREGWAPPQKCFHFFNGQERKCGLASARLACAQQAAAARGARRHGGPPAPGRAARALVRRAV